MNESVESEDLECWFLIPIVRDSDRKQHQPILWRLLEEALSRFGGWTGPERTNWCRKVELVPGGWMPEGSNKPIKDESRKYTVFLPPAEIEILGSLLRKVANSFDQQEILLCIGGRRKRIIPTLEDGFLE